MIVVRLVRSLPSHQWLRWRSSFGSSRRTLGVALTAVISRSVRLRLFGLLKDDRNGSSRGPLQVRERHRECWKPLRVLPARFEKPLLDLKNGEEIRLSGLEGLSGEFEVSSLEGEKAFGVGVRDVASRQKARVRSTGLLNGCESHRVEHLERLLIAKFGLGDLRLILIEDRQLEINGGPYGDVAPFGFKSYSWRHFPEEETLLESHILLGCPNRLTRGFEIEAVSFGELKDPLK